MMNISQDLQGCVANSRENFSETHAFDNVAHTFNAQEPINMSGVHHSQSEKSLLQHHSQVVIVAKIIPERRKNDNCLNEKDDEVCKLCNLLRLHQGVDDKLGIKDILDKLVNEIIIIILMKTSGMALLPRIRKGADAILADLGTLVLQQE